MLSASLVNGTLLIEGTDGDDRIVVAIAAANPQPTDREKMYSVWSVDGVQFGRFRYKDVKRVVIHLGQGNDTANQGVNVDTTGYFTQMIHVPVLIDGGAGNDTLWVTAVHVTLVGGEGNDTIGGDAFNERSRFRMDGGDGDDSIIGTDGNDRIVGRDGNDYIDARGGNDVIYGGNGSDSLVGGDGRDYLNAAAGDDRLIGGDLRDILIGGAGADVFDFLSDQRGEAKDFELNIDHTRPL